MIKSILGILVSDVFKTACVAFLLAFFITFATKSSRQVYKTMFQPIARGATHLFRLFKGKVARVSDTIGSESGGVPMEFEGDESEDEGWGVCTLSNISKIGRSQYKKYDFKLPRADNVLQLALGQQVTLCCLDSADNVAKKNVYTYTPQKKKGKNPTGYFSIVTKEYEPEDDIEMKKRRARGEGDFVSDFKLMMLSKSYMPFFLTYTLIRIKFLELNLKLEMRLRCNLDRVHWTTRENISL